MEDGKVLISELKRELIDEKKASSSYIQLAKRARLLGMEEEAEYLESIAEDEKRHHEILNSIVSGEPISDDTGYGYLSSSIADELHKLSSRLETALAEGDNPVSAKCSLVLDATPKCYDFSGTRRFAACRAWELMESERISWQEAISRAWDEIKVKCTWK